MFEERTNHFLFERIVGANINGDQSHGQKGAIGNPNIKSQLSHPAVGEPTQGPQTRGNARSRNSLKIPKTVLSLAFALLLGARLMRIYSRCLRAQGN